jgi:hypothetical protein
MCGDSKGSGKGTNFNLRYHHRPLPPRLQLHAAPTSTSTKSTTASCAVQHCVATAASSPACAPASVVRATRAVCTDDYTRGSGYRHKLDPDRRGARSLSLRPSPDRRARSGHEVLLHTFTFPTTSATNTTEHTRGHSDRAAARKAASRRNERRGSNASPHGRGRIHPTASRAKPGSERAVGSLERRELTVARRAI